jgi:predicted PurR-regulated permease PerM
VAATRDATTAPVSLDFDAATYAAVAVATMAFIFAFGVIESLASMLLLVGLAAILALALDPVVDALQRRLGVRRVFAVGVVGTVLLGVAGFVVAVMGPPAIDQAEKFSKELPETVREMYSFPIVGDRLERADAADKVEEWARDLPARLDDRTLGDIARSILGGLMSSFVVAIVAFALLLDGESMVRRVRRLVPLSRRDQADRVGRVFYRVFGRYFAGSLLVAMLAGLVILAIGLALSVPLAPLAALWMVLVNLIPQIGGLLGGSVFVLLAVTKDLPTGIACLVLFVLYNTFENHVLQPAIVGQSVDLSPPTTMMAALVGGAAVGVPGALVATPIVGTAKVLYRELRFGASPDTTPPNVAARLRRRWGSRRGREGESSDAATSGPEPDPRRTPPA